MVSQTQQQPNRTRSETMKNQAKVALAAGAVALAVVAGTGIASAAGGDDAEVEAPISGSALDQASAAALAHTGEGRVTETEVGDEESMYEVEVTLDDGSQVDVQLDEAFEVVSAEADAEEPGDSD